MKTFVSLTCLALGICLFTNQSFGGDPPNWKVSAAGETIPANDGSGLDLDTFAGKSTHLGKFHGEGAHRLNPDFTFEGYATYTAANGDQLDVIYTGSVVSFTEFPFPIEGEFIIVGGTGRLANATGHAHMTGDFTGIPGDVVFELNGVLHPQGK